MEVMTRIARRKERSSRLTVSVGVTVAMGIMKQHAMGSLRKMRQGQQVWALSCVTGTLVQWVSN